MKDFLTDLVIVIIGGGGLGTILGLILRRHDRNIASNDE